MCSYDRPLKRTLDDYIGEGIERRPLNGGESNIGTYLRDCHAHNLSCELHCRGARGHVRTTDLDGPEVKCAVCELGTPCCTPSRRRLPPGRAAAGESSRLHFSISDLHF